MGPHQMGMRRLRGQDPAHPASRRAQGVVKGMSETEEEMSRTIRTVMMILSRVAISMGTTIKKRTATTTRALHHLMEIKMMMTEAPVVERSIIGITVTAAEATEAIIIEATEIKEEEGRVDLRSLIWMVH